jgi:hypothetical protein
MHRGLQELACEISVGVGSGLPNKMSERERRMHEWHPHRCSKRFIAKRSGAEKGVDKVVKMATRGS